MIGSLLLSFKIVTDSSILPSFDIGLLFERLSNTTNEVPVPKTDPGVVPVVRILKELEGSVIVKVFPVLEQIPMQAAFAEIKRSLKTKKRSKTRRHIF